MPVICSFVNPQIPFFVKISSHIINGIMVKILDFMGLNYETLWGESDIDDYLR